MQHFRPYFFFLALAATGTAQAQNINPKLMAPYKRYNVGLKAGTGYEFVTPDPTSPPLNTPSYYTGGVTGGYLVNLLGVAATLQADLLLTRRAASPWQTSAARNASLFVPIYVRTGTAAQRVHYLLGGGPSFWASGGTVPGRVLGRYATHPAEITSLVGVEARLLPLGLYETTVALTYRHSFSPALIEYRGPAGAPTESHAEYFSWLGATLNVYLHQPRRPR